MGSDSIDRCEFIALLAELSGRYYYTNAEAVASESNSR